MDEEKIKMLLKLNQDNAVELMKEGEWVLYKSIRNEICEMVKEFEIQLPLRVLQFVYCDKSPYTESINVNS